MKTIWKVLIIVLAIIIIGGLAFFIYMKTTYLSKDEVQDIVIDDINQNKNDIYFESVDFEFDEKAYDVNVYYNNVEYEYKIDAKNGRIIYTDFTNNSVDMQNNQNVTNNGTGAQNGQNNGTQNIQGTNGISLNEAKQIAFEQAEVTEANVNITKAVHEVDDGIDVFEIEFNDNNYEYDFTINKNTGEVISYDRDQLHR